MKLSSGLYECLEKAQKSYFEDNRSENLP
jgi:hypothetical protein